MFVCGVSLHGCIYDLFGSLLTITYNLAMELMSFTKTLNVSVLLKKLCVCVCVLLFCNCMYVIYNREAKKDNKINKLVFPKFKLISKMWLICLICLIFLLLKKTKCMEPKWSPILELDWFEVA